jgi:hypothetical protein
MSRCLNVVEYVLVVFCVLSSRHILVAGQDKDGKRDRIDIENGEDVWDGIKEGEIDTLKLHQPPQQQEV